MHRSPPPYASSGPQLPPPEVNGWGRWVAGAISHLSARADHHEAHAESLWDHVMELKERMRAAEVRAERPPETIDTKPEKSEHRPSLEDWTKALKELGTAAIWIVTMAVGVAHAMGWLSDGKFKVLSTLLGQGH